MATRQSEGWAFNRMDSQPRQCALREESHQVVVRAEPPQVPPFNPYRAIVQQGVIPYPKKSLLGLAAEVRFQIWEHVQTLIESQRKAAWSSKPKTDFDGLPLVCRQLYHEVQDYWHRSIVPSNRLNGFLEQTYRRSVLLNFKSLSLELQFATNSGSYVALLNKLDDLAPRLQNLQLFFTGSDMYGTRVYLHGCGNKLEDGTSRERKLPLDGQGFDVRFPLINALARLANLRTLVLSNLNMPIYQPQILKNKPQLEKLCVISDPRSTLHFPRQRRWVREGLLVPVHDKLPPVKQLYLSANAALGAVQIPGKLSVTLEKLTWVVPNVARQAGCIAPRWHEETGILLRNLRSNSKKLHTLRICMEGSFYEGSESYGDLIGAFREHIPRITSLKNLELHLWSKSPFIAQEFIFALPLSLQRFYLSDKLAPFTELLKRIRERYLPSERIQTHPEAADYFKSEDETEIKPMEEMKRKDYITFHRGNLGFVNYEYDNQSGQRSRVIEAADLLHCDGRSNGLIQEVSSEPDSIGVTVCILNGQLLDREVNSFLAKFKPGAYIPPSIKSTGTRAHTPEGLLSKVIGSDDPEAWMKQARSIDLVSTSARVEADSLDHEADVQEYFVAADPKAEFHFRHSSYDDYFGNEDEAEKVFEAECVRDPTFISPRKHPRVVLCPTGYEDHEHWMCN